MYIYTHVYQHILLPLLVVTNVETYTCSAYFEKRPVYSEKSSTFLQRALYILKTWVRQGFGSVSLVVGTGAETYMFHRDALAYARDASARESAAKNKSD